LERARGVLGQAEENRRQRHALGQDLKGLELQLAHADNELRAAERDLEEWHTAWAEVVQEFGLDTTATPAEALVSVDKNQELFQKLDQSEGLHRRIESVRREADEFRADVKSLTEWLAPDLCGRPEEQIVGELNAGLARAREDAATREQLTRQLTEKQAELGAARDAIRETAEKLGALCREAHCAAWEELEEVERRSEALRELDRRAQQLDERLLAHSGGATVEEFLRAAEEADPDLLPEQIRTLGREIETLEQRLSAVEQRIGSERAELQRMDGSGEAAEAAEQAQGVLARIREDAERYIRLRLGSTILRREIERYRTKNQGPLLERASRLFSHLTHGSFAGLKTTYDEKDIPVLVGLRPSGENLGVEGMSDGSRDQLYLALRLATLEGYLERSEPLPFIIDDILINFDDERSAATLEVLAELSARTQVIFFTHHPHLVALAEKAVSADVLRVHTIG
jgi:uncharacterized protein YhaN